MAKTIALFFVLGLMVSCASFHNERSLSSVDEPDKQPGHFDRASFIGGHY